MNTLKRLFSAFLVLVIIFSPKGFAGASDFDIVRANTFVLGGVSKSSWGSVVSPWEDQGTTTKLTSAPTKFILTHSSGDMFAVGFTAGSGDITLENGQVIDGGTNNAFKFTDNSDTLTISATGSDFSIDSSDGGVIFALTDATDGAVYFETNNDTDDYIKISTTANQSVINFVGQNGKITADSGTIDFDNENLTTTGTAAVGNITGGTYTFAANSEVLSNTVDGFVRAASNSGDGGFNVFGTGTSDSDAILRLTADAGADNGDIHQLVSDGATNSLLFQNNLSGSQATIMTLAASGIVTFTNDLTLENADVLDNSTDDFFKFMSDDSDTTVEITGFEAKDAILKFCADQCDDNADSWKMIAEHGGNQTLYFQNRSTGSDVSTLVLYNTGSLGLISGDYIKNLSTGTVLLGGSTSSTIVDVNTAGTTDQTATLQLTSDNGADNGDKWQFKNDAGSSNVLSILNNTSGSFVQKLGIGTDGILYLSDSERLQNTGDVLYLAGDDNDTGFAVQGFEAKDAFWLLQAAESDDNGDDWKGESDQSTNSFILSNDTSGSMVAKMTLTTGGNVSFTGTAAFTSGLLTPVAVASLGTATDGRFAIVNDAASGTDCTSGGGSTRNLCIANGSAWIDA